LANRDNFSEKFLFVKNFLKPVSFSVLKVMTEIVTLVLYSLNSYYYQSDYWH
jgi:hypothetical protein